MRQYLKITCTHRFGYFAVYHDLPSLELDALVRNYHYLLPNNPEEHCTQLLRGGNLKSRLDASTNINMFLTSRLVAIIT